MQARVDFPPQLFQLFPRAAVPVLSLEPLIYILPFHPSCTCEDDNLTHNQQRDTPHHSTERIESASAHRILMTQAIGWANLAMTLENPSKASV